MKKIIGSPFVLAVVASSVLSTAPSGFAATYSKANNATALNSTASWATATVPTGTDIALWDNTVTAANAVALGANLTFGQIAITNPGGGVTINAGNTLTLNGVSGIGIDMSTATQNLTIAAPVILGANQSWTVGTGRTLTVSGVTSGGFALSKDGVGALVLSGANTYSGGTSINAGTLTLGNNTGAGTGAITVGSTGTLGLNTGVNVANVVGGSGTINSTNNIISGSLSGFTGTLNVISNVTGKTAIASGVTLGASTTTSVASGATFYVNGGATAAGAISLTGTGNSEGFGALRAEGTVSGGITLLSDSTIGANSAAGTISGIIGGTGFGFAKWGGQTVNLTGANTYSGITTVSQGTLALNGAGTLANTSGIVVSGSGATFVLGDTTASTNKINTSASLTVGGVGGTGIFTLTKPTTGVTSQTFTALNAAPGANVINNTNGTGSLVFSGTGGSSYTRSAGAFVNFASGAGSATFTTAPTGSGVVGTTAPILVGAVLNGTDFVTGSAGDIAIPTYTANTFGSGVNTNITASNTFSGDTQSIRFGTNGQTVTLSGTTKVESGGIMNAAGNVSGTITGGALQAASGANLWFSGNSGSNLTVASQILDNSGSGLEKFGANTVTLNGANTFTGQVWLGGGGVNLGSTTALGTGTANLNVVGTTQLQANVAGISIARNVVLYTGQGLTLNTNGNDLALTGNISSSVAQVITGATITKTGVGKLTLSGTNVLTTPLTLNITGGEVEVTGTLNVVNNLATAGATTAAGGILTFSGNSVFSNLAVGGQTGDWNFGGASQFVTMNIKDNASVTIGSRLFFAKGANGTGVGNQTGGTLSTGTLGLNSDNNAGVSATYNLDGGVLKLGSGGIVAGIGGVMNFNGGNVLVTAGNNLAYGATTSGSFIVKAGGAKIDTQAFTTNVNAPLQHDSNLGVALDGGLTKSGVGTLSLAAANTYTGNTTVKTGTLGLNFSATTAPATNIVNTSSALVLGNGTVAITGKASTTNSQTFNGTSLTGGGASFAITNNATANPVAVALGGITRSTGATVNFAQPTVGTVGSTNGYTTTNANDATGILGTWAAVGSGANLQYASNNGTNVVAYAGATAATGNLANVTSATTNYSYSAASVLGGATTANTLRYTGAATTTDIGSNNLTVNGLMNAGTGTLTISGAGSVLAGSDKELVITSNTQNTVISSVIGDSVAGASVLTYRGGSATATLTLNSANTYSGGTFINAGTLAIGAAGNLGLGDVIVGSGTLTLGSFSSINDLALLSFTNTSTINLNFTGSETIGNLFSSYTNTSIAAGTYTAAQLNTFFGTTNFAGTGTLNVTAVPEPGTWGLVGAGLAIVAVLRRRSRNS